MVENINKIFSALVTPINEDESLNLDALKRLVNFEINSGVEGFYCCGSSGEGLLLSNEERKLFLETVIKEVNGRVPVVSHIGTIRTNDVIDLAKHAKSMGVAAVSMIPPYYYKFSMDEIMKYYEDVIDAVSDLPVIVYNIPQFTGVSFTKENAGRLLDNPRVVGIKHTSTDLFGLERMVQNYPEKTFLNGFDEIFLSGLAAGATAAIGTTVNLYPKTFKRIRELYQCGEIEHARQVQHLVNHRVEETVAVGIFSAMKYILKSQGIDCGICRKPFKELTDDQKARLDKLIAEGFEVE